MIVHPKMKHIYVGVDTHKWTHTAVVINCFAEKLGEVTIQNRPAEFEGFLKDIKVYTKRGVTLVFGLEDTASSGRELAIFLLKKKKTVKQVASSLTWSERKNQPINHKTDSYDALCIARILLSKFDELPDADPRDIYWTLGMLVGRRNAVVKANAALKNQIHGHIVHHYPSYRQFFTVFDCKAGLEFWEKYPSPSKLAGVTVEELAKLLHESSSSFFGTAKAEEILNLVASDGYVKTEYQDARDFIVATCVREVKQNNQEIKYIETEIKNLMDELDYKLETMIGIDLVTAAGFVTEIGNIERFASADKLAKYSGIAPIDWKSGDRDTILKNSQGDRKLYQLFHDLAARNINQGRNKDKPFNGIFYDYYQKKLSQGKTKHQAIVCVMRRLVNIIYGMMKNKTEYVHTYLPKETTG
jgi:transposase